MIGGDRDAAREGAKGPFGRYAVILPVPRRFGATPWLVVGVVLAAVVGMGAFGTGYSYRPVTAATAVAASAPPANPQKEVPRLRTQRKSLEALLRQKGPHGIHIIIDQTLNRLYLKKDDAVLLEATCSAGSGMILEESGERGRRWIFDTPRGQFRVLQKVENPVWKKPDWAFVEEGKPIPKDPDERFEYGTLGEYALHFGNGYMIHGTLYERLLGRSVTHGCIRLGREDLRTVWGNVSVGTPIYIY